MVQTNSLVETKDPKAESKQNILPMILAVLLVLSLILNVYLVYSLGFGPSANDSDQQEENENKSEDDEATNDETGTDDDESDSEAETKEITFVLSDNSSGREYEFKSVFPKDVTTNEGTAGSSQNFKVKNTDMELVFGLLPEGYDTGYSSYEGLSAAKNITKLTRVVLRGDEDNIFRYSSEEVTKASPGCQTPGDDFITPPCGSPYIIDLTGKPADKSEGVNFILSATCTVLSDIGPILNGCDNAIKNLTFKEI